MNEAVKETLGFQTEVKQLLNLMVHSLYSNKEIFLRELISNASDANDKLRFEALHNKELLENQPELDIRIEFDKERGTVAIIDNGIGMSKEDVIEHLGTIAKSGTAQFLTNLTGDQKQDAQLIGQFGVGFYSAFVVADRVEVFSRKAGLSAGEGVHWESTGEGEFTVQTISKSERGTRVLLHLKADEVSFADGWQLRTIIRKYSDHIAFPVLMEKEKQEDFSAETDEDAEEKDAATVVDQGSEESSSEKKEAVATEEQVPEWETVNKATALWVRGKTDISDEEYKEFYKHISHDFEEPLIWGHNKVEGNLEYTSLLYIPKRSPFDLYNRDTPRGLKLYVQRVFIMDDAEQFLPLYLRFIKGIVDSNDLPLNVSREILQNDKSVETIKSALVKRVLDMLTKLSKKDADAYNKFWSEFGQVIKEGPAEDFGNREKIAGLLRFSSSKQASSEQTVSLDDYIDKMSDEQKKIYYITAENYASAANSPHLEIFKKKDIEVLLLSDRIDEWMTGYLTEYKGKNFQHVAKGDLDLGELQDQEEKKEQEDLESASKDFIERLKETLNDKVSDVKITHRLTDSPCCLVLGAYDMGVQMRQIMQAAGQKAPESKPIMEVNITHPLVEKLKEEIQEDRFADLAFILFDQAALAEGGQLDNPSAYVNRIHKLLLELSVN